MKKCILTGCLILIVLILTSAKAMAQDGRINFGNLKVIPTLTIQEIYDDNLYLGNGTNNTTEIEESDWITHLMPGLLFDHSFPERGSVKLGYRGDFAYYGSNDDNDWKSHSGTLALDYKAPGGIILGINNRYKDTEDPYGSDNDYKLGTPKTERWSNDLKSKIGYDFSNRFKVLLFYNFYKQDYDLEADYHQDYDSNEFGLGFRARLFPRTWGFIRYHHGERDYYTHLAGTGVTEINDGDFDWNRVNLGLTWDTDAKLSGELNFGYKWKDYENEIDPGGNRYDDKDTWIASTAVNFTATPTTTLSLSITRALRDVGSDSKEYYEDTGIGLNLQQMLYTKFTLTAGVVYSTMDYNLPVNNNREDDNYKANIGIDYQIQDWLKAGTGYNYSKKDSNSAANDYTDNQFMISLSAVY